MVDVGRETLSSAYASFIHRCGSNIRDYIGIFCSKQACTTSSLGLSWSSNSTI